MNRLTSISAMVVLVIMGLGQAIQAQETEVEIRRGEVLQVVGNTLLVRVEGEGVKRYTVPSDFRFNYEGSEITVRELREGMILTGVRLRTTGAADVEDIDTAMAEIAEAPAEEMAEDAADEATESAEAEEAESAEAPAAAAESAEAPAAAAEATSDDAVASAEEAMGMSPALMVGLVLLVLILIVFAVKGLGGDTGKKTGK